jgi:arylsulfatase A-like enzyme
MADRDIVRRVFGATRLLLAASALCLTGCGRDAPDGPDVLLVSVDTLRADHVGSYGHRLDTTPNLDRLAASGVRFEDATVQSPKTWPSMASMLTSTYPATNGIRIHPRRPLPSASLTLAETLREAGYRTGAVVANVNLGREFAFDQGFDLFVESWAEALERHGGDARLVKVVGGVKRFTNATLVTDQGIALLEELASDRPFFLWLHYMDPHGPYLPPREYGSLFADAYPREPVEPGRIPAFQRQRSPRTGELVLDTGFYRAQYDREIRYFDDELGRLLEAVERLGLHRSTLIALTADHGESLGEHDHYFRHGPVPYQTNAHVPLVLRLPGRLPAGRVVEAPVALLDLMPTILELAGVGVPPPVRGTSLLPRIDDGDAEVRLVFMESGSFEPWQLSVRRGPWKLVHVRAPRDRERLRGGEFLLFDVARDPGETHNLAARRPEIKRELQAALEEWLRTTPEYRGGEQTPLESLDPDTREMLEALGYVDEPAPEAR